jgi:hypothetical protein
MILLQESAYQFIAIIKLNCLASMDHGVIIVKLKNSSLYI